MPVARDRGRLSVEIVSADAVKRSITPLFAFLLSLLLVSTQLEGAVHKLGHVGEWLKHAHDRSIYTPNAEPCAECALIASGAHAAAGSPGEVPIALAPQERSHFVSVSFEPAFSSYYLSRAPPSRL